MHRLIISIVVLVMLHACAAVPDDRAAVERTSAFSVAEAQVVTSADTARGLPPQSLAPNQCGLFLWSKTDTSRFVFFMRAGTENALFLLEDLPTSLVLGSQGGDIFGQFLTNMTFSTASGRMVSLNYEPGAPLEGGARVANGLMEFADDDGWRIVLPVVGARVCQPAVSGQPRSGALGATQ